MNSLSNDGNNNNNWLGFTLSPQMEGHGPSNAPVSSFPHTPPSHMNYPIVPYYVGQGQTTTPTRPTAAAFFSSLSVMPLKSDGSLCLMEALNRSQPQATPKLEDFIGMGAHDYDIRSGGMALSLDNMYYQDYQMPTAGMKSFCNNNNNNNNNNNARVSKDGGESWAPNNGATGYGDFRALSLSMSHGWSRPSQQQQETLAAGSECRSKKRGLEVMANSNKQIVHRKSLDTFGQRTSQYRGVTRHRWTGRYEAHLWDNSCMKEGQSRKGKQGGYDNEEKAARAYDLAAIKYWGPSTHINFPLENYHQEIEGMKSMSRQEYVAHLRRQSSGFSRGASIYRGVTSRHHQHGRWQARIGRVAGNKDLYLGTFGTQEEAAEAYDIAAIKFRGANAVTNFDSSTYDIERIMASNNLLARDQARRPNKNSPDGITAETNSRRLEVEENLVPSSPTQMAADWQLAVYQQGVVDESAALLRRPFFAAWTDNII
ncbi:hypothetical protein DM860_015907 [Cuscuta australis]|uniref:AP2/ERF domain-containing protein n=1 Tax=Cuscuta australis TaxID=267555 RepID=A0A328DZX6_9ASTE|nr:hypothetical protein DM860_015907 [Cuscuta australis]